MSETAFQCEENARKVYSALPALFGFRFETVSQWHYELRSDKCVVQLKFDRYDPSTCVVLLDAPTAPSKQWTGMSLWVLRHMRGVEGPQNSSLDQFIAIGRILVERFDDLLTGEFSTVSDYPQIEKRILDRMFDADALPVGHPIRARFENYDIRWLDDLEKRT